jgi:hypothetical protein
MVGAAALAFVWAMVLARATHPGKASGASSPSTAVSSSSESESSFEGSDDSGSVQMAPAQSVPQVSTGSS